MTIETIHNSKKQLRQRLAAEPIVVKLKMLDALRERELSIRKASLSSRQSNDDTSPNMLEGTIR